VYLAARWWSAFSGTKLNSNDLAPEANAREYVQSASRSLEKRHPGIFKARDGYLATAGRTALACGHTKCLFFTGLERQFGFKPESRGQSSILSSPITQKRHRRRLSLHGAAGTTGSEAGIAKNDG
jgi:hypothetical protein